MSALRSLDDSSFHRLPARARLGRGLDADVLDPGEHASRHHALLRWRDGGWWIRDERSRNGTWVDGRCIGAEEQLLSAGQQISLGRPEPRWFLVDGSPPRCFARREDRGQEIEARDGAIVLPSQAGEVTIGFELERGAWVRDDEPEGRPLVDRARVQLDDLWELFLFSPRDATISFGQHWELSELTLVLRASRDLEHVSLGFRSETGTERWLPAQEIFWPLYLLARARLQDRDASEHDQGWMDVDLLATESGLPRRTLDVYVVRLRARLAREGLIGAGAIVEVRRGQRRIGLQAERILLETAE